MRTKLWMVAGAAAMWACGGTTFTGPSDGGAEGGSSSSSGSSGGSSSGGSGSSSGASGSSGSGGSSGSSSGGSGSSSGTGSGSSSGGSNPSCPPNAPNGGTACQVVGMACEYGNNPNPQCNEIETCQSNHLWSYPPPGGAACPPGTCPATYAAVPQGQTCTPQGLDCSYPEGQCNCAPTLPTSGPNPVWQCIQPAAGCPEPRPDIGSACTQPTLSCDYGACTGGVELQCTDGSWQVVVTPCPV